MFNPVDLCTVCHSRLFVLDERERRNSIDLRHLYISSHLFLSTARFFFGDVLRFFVFPIASSVSQTKKSIFASVTQEQQIRFFYFLSLRMNSSVTYFFLFPPTSLLLINMLYQKRSIECFFFSRLSRQISFATRDFLFNEKQNTFFFFYVRFYTKCLLDFCFVSFSLEHFSS